MSSRDPEIQRFLKIAKSVASETGQAVLFRLVASLSDYLDAAFVAVTYGEGNPVNHARALYALKNQEAVHDVRYALEGTPCERVNAGEVLTVPCEIAELYPRETGYEGYIGIPLRDDAGGVAGHLVIFTCEEILKPELATAICMLCRSGIVPDRRGSRKEKTDLGSVTPERAPSERIRGVEMGK